MQNERQSSSGNQFAYCLSFLRAMRYLKSDSDTIKTVQQWCRTYQKAYERKDRSWQRLEAEGKWLAWDAVLEVLKQQRELYESSGPCELTRAQESQKYTVLLLYCSIPPARSKEYRELRVTFSRQNLATCMGSGCKCSLQLVGRSKRPFEGALVSRCAQNITKDWSQQDTAQFHRLYQSCTGSTGRFCMSGQRRLTERQRPSRHNRLAVSGNLNLHACMLYIIITIMMHESLHAEQSWRAVWNVWFVDKVHPIHFQAAGQCCDIQQRSTFLICDGPFNISQSSVGWLASRSGICNEALFPWAK